MEPLLTLDSSGLSGSGDTSLRVFENRLEIDRAHLRGLDTNVMRYENIASVWIRNGLFFSTLSIESRGGATALLKGLPRRKAKEAQDLINSKLVV